MDEANDYVVHDRIGIYFNDWDIFSYDIPDWDISVGIYASDKYSSMIRHPHMPLLFGNRAAESDESNPEVP